MYKRPTFMRYPLAVYIILWAFSCYLFVYLLSFSVLNPNSPVLSALYFVNYSVHETAHIVTVFLPALLTASAGSLSEIALAGLVIVAALCRKAYFAVLFGMQWMMLSLHSAGTYMADARRQALPLMGPGENIQHDWHFVFGQLNLLRYDTVIGGALYIFGTVVGAAGLALGIGLIVMNIRARYAKTVMITPAASGSNTLSTPRNPSSSTKAR